MVASRHNAESITRRSALQGLGLSALAAGSLATLSGCGQDHKPTPAPSRTPQTVAPTVVPKASVPVGEGTVLERKYVVTQPTAGEFKAFTKVCPHQGCLVSFVKEGSIVCACHSSLFSIADGKPTEGPAKSGLSPVPVKEVGDNLEVG